MRNTSSTLLPTRIDSQNCLDVAEFQRLNYFFGQLLSPADFQLEQKFFREKLKLHNRCLHGYGTICGLLVEPVPIPRHCTSSEEEHEKQLLVELKELRGQKLAAAHSSAASPAPAPTTPSPFPAPSAAAPTPPAAAAPTPPTAAASASPAPPSATPASPIDARIEELLRELGGFYQKHCAEEPRTFVNITTGIALDCEGNELVLRRSRPIDLLQWLSPEGYKRVKQGAHTLYVSICYCETPGDLARTVIPDVCGSTSACNNTRITECIQVRVTVDPPHEDCRCESCCACCADKCLLLARIDGFRPGLPLFEFDIHNGVRRHLHSSYQPTVITGVSWKNGHYYSQEETRYLMGTREEGEHESKGLEIRFSRPVRASTIHPGVVDTWVIEGGRGRAGNIYNKPGEFVDKPADGLVHRVIYRDTSRETLEPGDRVLITLRTEFILDECCHPIDGVNVGGRVPVIKEFAEKFHLHDHYHDCHVPPCGYGPWTSGAGVPCGGFQGWFYVRQDQREQDRNREGTR